MPDLVPNLRDLGGLRAGQDRVTAYGVLLRSATPTTTDGAPDSVTWPPAQVIDLRSPMESGPDHPLDAPGTQVRQVSLLEALRPDLQLAHPELVEQMRSGGLATLYLGMLDVARQQILEVVRLVADHPGPTLVHCAAGKDRTGVVVALLLRSVGVSRDDVVADYLETGRATAEIVRRLSTQPLLDPSRPPPASYLDLPVGAINGVLDLWDHHRGGVVGWLEESGADAGLAASLRERLTRGA